MKFNKVLSLITVGTVGMIAAPLASAAEANTTFPATITIQSNCTATGGAGLDFGTHGTAESNIDAQTTITVNCTSGTGYKVGLAAASNPGSLTGVGNFNFGGTLIPYQLYQDSGRTTIWGNNFAAGTANIVAGTGTAADQTITVYARVADIPDTINPNTYNDTVNVKVTY